MSSKYHDPDMGKCPPGDEKIWPPKQTSHFIFFWPPYKYHQNAQNPPFLYKKDKKNFQAHTQTTPLVGHTSRASGASKLDAFSVSSPVKLNAGNAPAWYCEIMEFQYSRVL